MFPGGAASPRARELLGHSAHSLSGVSARATVTAIGARGTATVPVVTPSAPVDVASHFATTEPTAGSRSTTGGSRTVS